MDKENVTKGCPRSEILEEYRDGTVSDEWMSHIDNCEICQRRIASLDLLDLRIRSVCLPPEGMAARIKAAVHEGREPSIRPMPFWRRAWFRAAAASAVVVLLASASLYLAMDSRMRGYDGATAASSAESMPDVASEPVNEPPAPPKMTAAAKDVHVQEKARPAAPSALSFDSSLRLAATLGQEPAAKRSRQVVRQPLGNAVRHLWSVEESDAASEFIHRIAKANGKNVEMEPVSGGFNASIELKDTELQQLVDMLDEKGWRLLSPYAPQPGEPEAVDFRNSPVLYYINVIEKGK